MAPGCSKLGKLSITALLCYNERIVFPHRMITDQETLAMKRKILEEIASRYEDLIKAGQMDEEEAKMILGFVEEEIQPTYREQEFSKAIFEFCDRFPEFAAIGARLKNLRSELLQKIAQECIENLMDQRTEEWSRLTEKIPDIQENTLETWVAQLAPEQRLLLMSKLLPDPQTDGI
jgi:hypothetical protein